MLSHSNSITGDLLRRAKSNASATTTSSGHLRSSTSIDPFVTQQHAEAAAVEAFNRARQNLERVAPPRVVRRKSQVTGRVEGSHLADARLNRRKSTSTQIDHGLSKEAQSHRQFASSRYQSEASNSNDGQERVVTRQRSIIPVTAYAHGQNAHLSLPPPTSRNLRRVQSAYSEGSPTPRHSTQVDEQSSILKVRTPVRKASTPYQSNPANFSDFYSESAHVNPQSTHSARPSIRETQNDEEILTLARDKCLQDFHQRKIGHRKSFILAPFQRRNANRGPEITDDDYDNTLPPFNYAMDIAAAPPPLISEPWPRIVPHVVKTSEQKRNFSETLKGRFLKVFRKTSTVTNAIPRQEVNAIQRHYPNLDPACFQSISNRNADPFIVITPGSPAQSQVLRGDRAESRSSYGRASTMKSRVTSWTNSTIAATLSSRVGDDRLTVVDENGALKRNDSSLTLRKRSSFLGRPVLNKFRRASKTELCSSEDSHGLFAALQERIRPKTTNTPGPSTDDEPALHLRVPSAHTDMPTQTRPTSSASSLNKKSGPTIRPVPPAMRESYSGVPSPIIEVLSPLVEPPLPTQPYQPASNRRQHQRNSIIKAKAPSRELMAQRMEKSKNRWQSSLDELSSGMSYPAKATAAEDNPYQLPSARHSTEEASPLQKIGHSSKIKLATQVAARETLSPSVYSRGTNSASPQLESSPDDGGTVITITGHEVRRYSILPQRKELTDGQRAQGSREWRRWLSSEMNGLKTEGKDYDLTSSIFQETDHSTTTDDPTFTNTDANLLRASSASPTPETSASHKESSVGQNDVSSASETTVAAIRPSRPRANSSQRSSFMNDRYPMLDTGRNSSNNSVQSGRLSSSFAGNRNSSAESNPTGMTRPIYGTNPTKSDTTIATRIITARRSIAEMKTPAADQAPKDRPYNRRRSTMASKRVTDQEQYIQPEPIVQPPPVPAKASTRPKSACDLRANFKTSSQNSPKPLEVRRKPLNANIVEDETIVTISAGPYAAQSPFNLANKENATPPTDANSLPALSSSEWLAAGPNKSRNPSSIHPALRNRSTSRHLSSKTPMDGSRKESKGSPAQRMATDFLEKTSRESTPAFV